MLEGGEQHMAKFIARVFVPLYIELEAEDEAEAQ